jgi:hypothetical protein
MISRHEWFRKRIAEGITILAGLNERSDWKTFLEKSLEIANELHYAVTEWEKYYNDEKK